MNAIADIPELLVDKRIKWSARIAGNKRFQNSDLAAAAHVAFGSVGEANNSLAAYSGDNGVAAAQLHSDATGDGIFAGPLDRGCTCRRQLSGTRGELLGVAALESLHGLTAFAGA